MPFPDLSSTRDSQRASLTKVAIRRDPDGKTNDDLLYDLALAHLVDPKDANDLARLDAALPGASGMVSASVAAATGGGSGRRSQISDSSDVPDRWLSVQDPTTGIYNCWQRRSEVRSVKLRVVGPAVTAIVTMRVRGLDAGDAANLARLLEREVDVVYEDLNPRLITTPATTPVAAGIAHPKPQHRGWDGTVGCVVSGTAAQPDGSRRSVAGVVIGSAPLADGALLQVDDVGDVVWMQASEVDSSVHVVAPGTDALPDALARYANTAAEEGVTPSWRYLITAFGVAFAAGSLHAIDSGEWVLSPEISTSAVEMAKSATPAS